MNQNINRTKLHRFIRIHDDLEILNERLININDHSSAVLSNEQIRILNDLKLLFDRLNSIKRIVRIHLEQLEKLLAKSELNQSFSLSRNSSFRSSNNNLQVILQRPVIINRFFSLFLACLPMNNRLSGFDDHDHFDRSFRLFNFASFLHAHDFFFFCVKKYTIVLFNLTRF